MGSREFRFGPLFVAGDQLEFSMQVILIEPGEFRVVHELLQKECKGKGRIETLTFTATADT